MTGSLSNALDVRGIKSTENLVAEVEGDIEDVDGALKITTIRVRYRFKIPRGTREKADRALAVYVKKCPAYQTVKDCIKCNWEAMVEEL